jgi:DNA-binding beta-propeller fold protein YncE
MGNGARRPPDVAVVAAVVSTLMRARTIVAFSTLCRGNVAVVEAASHWVIKTIPVGTNPPFVVLGPDGRIWGTNTGGNDV